MTTGWPKVRAQCEEWGDRFDLWQDGLGRLALGKRSDGLYAATVGGVTLSIPRQVAKTFLVGRIVFALCALFPGLTVLWTAHRTRTATRTFQALQRFAKRRKVSPYIKHIRTANGEQEIAFVNGSVILFGAREQGFGRGFEEVDIEVFDEAQILTERALEDMVAATNQSRHVAGALLFYMGTPPRPIDPGEAFTLKRKKALSGDADDMVYVECSADREAELDDRKQWARANPSYPRRTPLESMLRLRENLPSDDAWRREALGIWDDDGTPSIMPTWPACSTRREPPAPACLAVAHDLDRVWLSVAAASRHGVPYVGEVTSAVSGKPLHFRAATGRTEALDEVARICNQRGIPVVVDAKDEPLIEDLKALDRPPRIVPAGFDDYVQGCADLFDAVESKELEHGDLPNLNAAVGAAGWSKGERRKFVPKSGEVSMLKAATLALWGTNQDSDSGGWAVAL